jgi:hypothetical protein
MILNLLSYGAVHLATATLVQNFHAMGKNPNLFSSCRNAPFESINQSSRGIIFKCKFERVILRNQAQIGHYIQMPMYISRKLPRQSLGCVDGMYTLWS